MSLTEAIRNTRREILEKQEGVHNQLATHYADSYTRLSQELDTVIGQTQLLLREGNGVNASLLVRRTRIQALLEQLGLEAASIGVYASELVRIGTETAITLALAHTTELIQAASGLPPAISIPAGFTGFDSRAVQEQLGRFARESPLRGSLEAVSLSAVDTVEKRLVHGLIAGKNPLAVASQIRSDLEIPLRRAQTIARTEMLSSYRQASQARYSQTKAVKLWRWLCARNQRTCAMCVAMDGKEFPTDTGQYTHPNCFPAGVITSGPRVIGSTARRYTGDIIEIETASGYLLPVTPNHPILTPHGWVAAGMLNEGGYVISRVNRDRGVPLTSPDDYQIPTVIEDIAESLGRNSGMISVRVPTSAEDFHGDGKGSNVCVIRADSLLGSRLNPQFEQILTQNNLMLGDASAKAFLAGYSSLTESCETILPPSARSMSRLRTFAVLLRSFILCNQYISRSLRTHNDAGTLQEARHAGSGDTTSLCETHAGSAGQVMTDKVLRVRRFPFSGHVYSLQTTEGWHVANGILSHNCRCTMIPITLTPREMGIDLPDNRPKLETARDWFFRQPEEVKLAILGRRKLELINEGTLSLDDLIGYGTDPAWGPHRWERSLIQIETGKGKA